jgi:putative nucleotidyltransferase-like protein
MLRLMSRHGVRFDPPALALGPAVRWMLLRAFGPVGAGGAAGAAGLAGAGGPAAPAVEAPAVLALCRRFELSCRVAARQGRARLAAELGAAAADGFARDQAVAAGAGLRLVALAERVAAAAAPLGVRPVFLKLAALELGGLLAPGSREGCDLDVLVPAGRAAELQQALAGAGFRASPMPRYEHQLAALESADGVVEVHRMLLGVRVAGKRSATAEDLDREGLLLALPALAGHAAAVPLQAVAAAHALVHGIAQHGWTPHAYSLLKMVADLVDLGFAGPDGPELAGLAARWIARDVAAEEVEAARRLCAALAAGAAGPTAGGDLAEWETSRAPEAVLLRHALAGRLDPGYEESLRLALFRRVPSDAPEAVRLARAVAGTVWLSRAQVDALYGAPRRRLGYLGRRLRRPLDLLARLGRYGLHAWKVRRRRPALGDGSNRRG